MKNMLVTVCCMAALIGCKASEKVDAAASASATAVVEAVPSATASATATAEVVVAPSASVSAVPAASAVPAVKK